MRQEQTSQWFAVKAAPGSQKPQREYKAEQTRSKKGYRIVPSLNPHISAIELALTKAGFDCYMPAEKRLVRDRRHTDLWKPRRFALLVGYIFVHAPRDWRQLKTTPGVSGVVSDGQGRPLPVSWDDILMLRATEAQSEAEFERRAKLARQKLRQKSKSDARLKELIARLDMAGTLTVPLEEMLAGG